MSIFFSYILLGISLAAPIGPVNAAQIDRGIKSGFLHAWFIGLGSITADLVYMMVVYLGVVHILDSPFIKAFLWLFGFFVLVYTGIETLMNTNKILIDNKRGLESLKKTFLTGFFMSISNPLTILFWLGIYGSVLAKTASTYSHLQLFFYSSAILVGLLVWDLTMAAVSSGFRKVLTPKLLMGISVFSGVTLVGFGLYFGWEAVKLLIL
ncbi:LysE family transporter [Metabacillus arenae]|uniref:LysE family transporter n=1 Tax=Metabacillus arenae TaxID=2771434 RepID=A0A926NMA5_9BACI|nr:LysE family transporter [Metabacillus arenae]MBD1382553.1 LysE family transporter [Metabacillus arenae]